MNNRIPSRSPLHKSKPFDIRKKESKSEAQKNGDLQSNLIPKVCLEISEYVENLVRKRLFELDGDTGDVNNKNEVRQVSYNGDLSNIVNKPEVFDKYKETEFCSTSLNVSMETEGQLDVIPRHLPTIQITVKQGGEKTTKIIHTKKETPRCRVWKKKLSHVLKDLFWITSDKTIFSNAILGKDILTPLIPSYDVPNSPKRGRISLSRLSNEQTSLSNMDTETCDSGIVVSPMLTSPEKSFSHEDNPSMNAFKSNDSLSTSSKLTDISEASSKTFPDKESELEESTPDFFSTDSLTKYQRNSNSNQSVILNLPPVQVNNFPMTTCDNSPKKSALQEHLNSDRIADKCSQNIVFNQSSGLSTPFKVPFLPKRPPSRIQKNHPFKAKFDLREVLQNRNRHQHVQVEAQGCVETSSEDFDAISLYAESLCGESETKSPEPTRLSPLTVETISTPKTPTQQIPQTSTVMEKVVCEKPEDKIINMDCRSESKPVFSKNPKVKNWIANTEKYTRNNFELKSFLSGSCFIFLKYGTCRRYTCRYSHDLPVPPNNFHDLPETVFQQLISSCIAYPFMFKNWFDFFLNYMSEHGRHDLVLYLVCDVMTTSDDKMPYIKKIISTLKNMGFTFDQAINEILLTAGRQNECLLDILLLFAVEEGDCIKTSWSLINNLTNFRKQALDFGVVQDIFQKCITSEPSDKNLCENIYKDIIIKNNFNLNEIDRTILLSYISLLMSFKLDHYACHIMANYNVQPEEVSNLDTPNRAFSPSSSINSKNMDTLADEQQESPMMDVLESPLNIDFDNESVASLQDETPNIPKTNTNEEILKKEAQEQEYLLLNDSYLPHSNYSKSEVGNYFDNVRSDDSGNCSQQCGTNSSTSFNYGTYYMESPAPYIPTTRKNAVSPICETASNSPIGNRDSCDMTNNDICILIKSVRTSQLMDLLAIIKKYSESNKMVRNLVVQIMAAIKSLSFDLFCELVSKMYIVFGEHCRSDYQVINALRYLGFNLLPILDNAKQYKTALDVLNIFSKDYHAFVKYDSIGKGYDYLTTKELKYIFLFKILSRCGRSRDALRLLKHPESELINSFLGNLDPNDNTKEYKLQILSDFIKLNLENNLSDAKDFIIYLMLNISIEVWSELKIFINILISNMLKKYSTYKSDIINMLDNILNCWYRYLKPSVLRAVLINLYSDISDKKILELFYLCIDTGVYPAHEGTENSISIPSDLVQEEVYLLLYHQILKICGSSFPIDSIMINVEKPSLEDDYSKLQTVLIGSKAPSPLHMTRRILNVLMRIKNFPNPDDLDISNRYIVLPYSAQFLQPYKKAAKENETIPLLKFR